VLDIHGMTKGEKEMLGVHRCPKCNQWRKAWPLDHCCPVDEAEYEAWQQAQPKPESLREMLDDEIEREWNAGEREHPW